MIVDREEEIKNFKPEDYYTLNLKGNNFTLNWVNNKGNSSIFNKEFADSLAAKVKGHDGEVVDITKSNKRNIHLPFMI